MPKGPQGQRRPADVIGNAVHVMRISQRVPGAFGIDLDYAQLVKHYGPTVDVAGPERKYSQGECCGISKRQVLGKPLKAFVSKSYVEKHNQTMRQHMKRFSRLTAAPSKKLKTMFTWSRSIRLGTILSGSILRSACLRLWLRASPTVFGTLMIL